MSESKWIHFIEVEPKPKTRVWEVWSNPEGKSELDAHELLGELAWLGRWRTYCFFPLQSTVFEQQCLRDIAEFCEERSQEHRLAKSAQCADREAR